MSLIVVAVWGVQLFVYLGQILLNAPVARQQSRHCNLVVERAWHRTVVPIYYHAPRRAVKQSSSSQVTASFRTGEGSK